MFVEIEIMIICLVEEVVVIMLGIKWLRVWLYDNMVEVIVEFDWDENFKVKSIEVWEKIDVICYEFFDDIEWIMVYKFNINDMFIF